MMVLALDGLTGSELTPSEQCRLVHAIEHVLKPTFPELEGARVLDGVRTSGWSFGKPCPECGTTKLNVLDVSDHWYRSTDEQPVWQEHGDGGSLHIDILCAGCATPLYTHPAYEVLYGPRSGDPDPDPGEIDTDRP